ncbi:MAG TPA: hypothetical protein VGL99_18415 [Chloroflexota bacterium]
MPPKPTVREPGLRFLEEKLSVYVQGPSQTRRNPALDLLTGRVPDTRFQSASPPPEPTPHTSQPATLVLARPILPPAVSHVPEGTTARSASPWLAPVAPSAQPRVRLIAPPPARPSPMALLPRALAVVVVGGVALGLGMVVRSLRAEPVVASAPLAIAAPVAAGPTVVVVPTVVAAPTLVPTAAPTVAPSVQPTTPPTPALADQFRLMTDERFAAPKLPWRSEPNGTSWLAGGAYHLTPRDAGRFVALAVPGATNLSDVVVAGSFRKVEGPAGGGYGLIVRDQSPAQRDGLTQDGRYYVFEVGDRGELGVWLRDGDTWLDLLPWTANEAVNAGTASNELAVSAIGDTLSFVVNGIPVASQRDTVLRRGGVGLFTGGDGNHVAIERLTVRVPR